jgi:integrase
VVEAIRRQLPAGAEPDALVFTGPGGGNGVTAGTRTTLSRHGFRRLYQTATHRARADTHLQLRGPHDLRHSFSTWLEDEGIPARVIDELMGHQRSRGGGNWRVAVASAPAIGTPPRRWPPGWSRRWTND